jgi:hypothetical protein
VLMTVEQAIVGKMIGGISPVEILNGSKFLV